ncbi:hypothetical protein RIF29_42274 [Crotalaria pallida]|uniref:Uncharacterized protein n=1 Tax=Crotalaria pallida TaxID=3830 RepID=A0AAN9E7U1_CROPI
MTNEIYISNDRLHVRDKLSKLNNNKPTATDPFPPSPSASSSASPLHFSSSSSNYVSPAYLRRHRRHASHVTDSVSYMISFNVGLKKSKSVAFAPRNRLREREVNRDNRGSKKDGFWSKLLKLAKKDTHSCIPGPRGREGVSHVKGLI